MGAVLAPWPFLDGGATAVLVATIFDGATVEEELLWRGGARVSARPGGGDVEVRLGACGFELVLPRACDGEVVVGTRVVELRELSLCGVTVLPLGPRTRVTVRVGMLTLRVEATTPPKRLPLAPAASWRQRAGVAVAALAGGLFAFVLHATAPRTPSWKISDHVLMRVSLLTPALHGGQAPSATAAESAAHAAVRPTAQAAATRSRAETASKRARAQRLAQQQQQMQEQQAQEQQAQAQQTQAQQQQAQQTQEQAQAQQTQAQQQQQTQSPQEQQTQAQQQPQQQQTQAQQQTEQKNPGEQRRTQLASLAAEPARRAVTDDDARRAAAIQARAAGIVGALAHSRSAFLGDERVAAADFTDGGSFAVGAGDASSAAGASGAAAGASGSGASGGGAPGGIGTLSGDEIGEAYGTGGLGLSGTGLGGGGSGDGTIGLGTIGTIGCGCGTGEGVGYGSGVGGLGGRRASVPDVVPGAAEVRGSCDKDLIRRVVHAHLNELRFCYERVLQSRPELAGRLASRFVIGFDGRVTASAVTASSLTPAVDACVAQAIARWQFAPRCVGEVNYPFLFEPIGNAP